MDISLPSPSPGLVLPAASPQFSPKPLPCPFVPVPIFLSLAPLSQDLTSHVKTNSIKIRNKTVTPLCLILFRIIMEVLFNKRI